LKPRHRPNLSTDFIGKDQQQAAKKQRRRFSPPWSVEGQPNHYVVRDANKLADVYYENEPGRRNKVSDRGRVVKIPAIPAKLGRHWWFAGRPYFDHSRLQGEIW
jgi:hypothetical protein